jgi:catechol 2,3-dioxygenase-like lactoylglutathione lyase family enzyme
MGAQIIGPVPNYWASARNAINTGMVLGERVRRRALSIKGASLMGAEIRHLHHVGLVVRDMTRALDLYRSLGFNCPPPAYPMISPREGAPPKPFGVVNTHAAFVRNFIELASVVSEDVPIPRGAAMVPIEVPATALPGIRAAIERTVATLAVGLSRFEGLHILVFQTDDVAASAARFDKIGLRHSGANTARRQIETTNGIQSVPVHVLEIDQEPVPEGRLAVAENPAAEILQTQSHTDHPNGAIGLVEALLCVRDDELDATVARYGRYIGRDATAHDGSWIFELEDSQVIILPGSQLGRFLPGETAPALAAFIAYAVSVRDLRATDALLKANGVRVLEAPTGDIFVPATSALGAAVIFR